MKRFLVSLIPVLLMACGGAPDYPKYGNGVLSNGEFSYLCVTPSDPFCAGTQNDTSVPKAIALGTSFRLTFTPAPGQMDATLGVETNEFLERAPDGILHAKRSGVASVFARNERGEVEDFINLQIQVPTSLAISGIEGTTTLKPNETRTVRAQPLGQSGAILAGSGTYDYETSDSNVVAIDTTNEDRGRGTATLRAVSAGTARVRVIFGSATTTFDILVGGV